MAGFESQSRGNSSPKEDFGRVQVPAVGTSPTMNRPEGVVPQKNKEKIRLRNKSGDQGADAIPR